MDLPQDVVAWVKNVFGACDARITQKISNAPNAPEESLDLTWIEHISQYSSPVTLASNWTVKIETHYLGGLRHFGRWEIADLGVLLFVRKQGRVENSKVALLQSKRLYPANKRVREEHRIDYQIGFSRLADPEDIAVSLATEAEFEFNDQCRYEAMKAGSEQVVAIAKYEEDINIQVYYQLYNPWAIPVVRRIPLSGYEHYTGEPELGTRVIPCRYVHDLMDGQAPHYSPALRDLQGFQTSYGWTLADFIGDEFLGCREGNQFDSISDSRIQNLFYRRSGPIAAAIAISVEAP